MKRTYTIDDRLGLEVSDIDTIINFVSNYPKLNNIISGNRSEYTSKDVETTQEIMKQLMKLLFPLFHEMYERVDYFGSLYESQGRKFNQLYEKKIECRGMTSGENHSTLADMVFSCSEKTVIPEENKETVLAILDTFTESQLDVLLNYESILKYVSDELRSDKDVVLEAVKSNGLGLRYASPSLRDDIEVVLAAVKQNGVAIQYSSDRLKNDLEVVVEAICNNYYALRYIPKDMWEAAEKAVQNESKEGYLIIKNNIELKIK